MEATRSGTAPEKQAKSSSKYGEQLLSLNKKMASVMPRKPTIKLGAGQVQVYAKQPLSLKQRMVIARQAEKFAQEKAEKLALKAEALAEAGSPQAAKMARIAEGAAARATAASRKVGKLVDAVKKKAEHEGAAMAGLAMRIAALKRGIEDRGPGGRTEFDAQNLDWYKKELAKATQAMEKSQAKAEKLESSFGMPGIVAKAAERQASAFIKKQQAEFNKDPINTEVPPKMEELRSLIGGDSPSSNEKGEQSAQGGKDGRPGIQEFTRPKGAGPDLGGNGAPRENKSNLGGAPRDSKPTLQRGELGGWYYETKSGTKVYVQK